jgi:hypothetical protein
MSDRYNQFMTANTIPMNVATLAKDHLIPVHIKDNEKCIAHHEFINSVVETAADLFGETSNLLIRVSHPIKGRIASAKHKAAKDLLPEETTLYYERMAWTINLPEHKFKVGDDELTLTVGGVKAFNQDNLYSTKYTPENFKVFIGFQNRVCTNNCISTDGFVANLKADMVDGIKLQAKQLFTQFQMERTANTFNSLNETILSEDEFAYLLGRARMYNAMPIPMRLDIPSLGVSDSQLSIVAEDYYQDLNHGQNVDGSISLWNMYNLFTGANKSSYIDTILDRNVTIFSSFTELNEAVKNKNDSWYLN